MCKIKVSLLLAFLFLVFSSISNANSSNLEFDFCSFKIKPYAIFYSNGVGNSIEQANSSLQETYDVLANSSDTELKSLVIKGERNLLYHANNGIVQDISETLLQKARAESKNVDLTWERMIAVVNGVLSANPSEGYFSLDQMIPAITSFQADQLKAKSLAQVDVESKDDLVKLMSYFRANPDSRALVIGHSQGSLYANSLYENAIKLQAVGQWPTGDAVVNRVRVVNVAAAADRVAGQANSTSPPQYLTSSYDMVIKALRGSAVEVGLNQPLLPNSNASFNQSASLADTFLGVDTDRLANHGYVSTYLSDTTSSYPLRKLLKNVMLENLVLKTSKDDSVMELEIDVWSKNDIVPTFADSTSFDYGEGPPIPLRGTYKFYSYFHIGTFSAGAQTIKRMYFLNCQVYEPLNLRPDKLDINLYGRSIFTSDTVNFSIGVLGLNQSVYLTDARIRVSSKDGLTLSPWKKIDISKVITTNDGYWKKINLDLFNYTEELNVGGVHMSVVAN